MLYYIITLVANLPIVSVPSETSSSFIPIGLQFIFVILFVFGMIGLSALLGPKRKTKDKLDNFASGITSHGDARSPMAVKYFLVAILFVLFDVEIVFFYPYATIFRDLGWHGFLAILLFLALFLVGFTYIMQQNIMDWEE
ncbi:MAG: NADH-quinone oxidoreductase subunit A [Phycisphaerales bacterium]|nr:NADH-quinone oxidoreductase subunit A [Phycisphaerales bacterium]